MTAQQNNDTSLVVTAVVGFFISIVILYVFYKILFVRPRQKVTKIKTTIHTGERKLSDTLLLVPPSQIKVRIPEDVHENKQSSVVFPTPVLQPSVGIAEFPQPSTKLPPLNFDQPYPQEFLDSQFPNKLRSRNDIEKEKYKSRYIGSMMDTGPIHAESAKVIEEHARFEKGNTYKPFKPYKDPATFTPYIEDYVYE